MTGRRRPQLNPPRCSLAPKGCHRRSKPTHQPSQPQAVLLLQRRLVIRRDVFRGADFGPMPRTSICSLFCRFSAKTELAVEKTRSGKRRQTPSSAATRRQTPSNAAKRRRLSYRPPSKYRRIHMIAGMGPSEARNTRVIVNMCMFSSPCWHSSSEF